MAETQNAASAVADESQSNPQPDKPKSALRNRGADAQPSTQPESNPRRRLLRPLIAVIVLVVAGTIIWKVFFAQPAIPDSIVALSGRIEGDDSAVSAKVTGRLLNVNFREGDAVKAGDTIAILDDQQVRDRQLQAEAAVRQSEARLSSAQQQVSILRDQLQQSNLLTEQSELDAEGKVHQAEAELAAANADLAQQEATLQLSLFDKEAYTRLAKSGAVSERQGRQAVSSAESQQALVESTRKRVEAAQGSLNIAKANLTNPGIRSSQASAVGKQIIQQQAEINSASADLSRARSMLAEAQSNYSDLTVKAPFDGVIATRTAEPGEVLQAGTAIVTLIDLSRVYLRGFIAEGQIGKVKLDQHARIYLDSNPKKPVDAYVSRIDPQATFTPENTYFRDDRVKQVVGVKLQIKEGVGYAKPGMPADGEILVSGDDWPKGSFHR